MNIYRSSSQSLLCLIIVILISRFVKSCSDLRSSLIKASSVNQYDIESCNDPEDISQYVPGYLDTCIYSSGVASVFGRCSKACFLDRICKGFAFSNGECHLCVDGTSTNNVAMHPLQRTYIVGELLAIYVDDLLGSPCDSAPCQYNGTCSYSECHVTCDCAPYRLGETCEIDVNECESNPCENGAECTDVVNGYTCSCTPEYQGTYCEDPIDACASNPCKHNGTCVGVVQAYTCDCRATWYGEHCEESNTWTIHSNMTCPNNTINQISGISIEQSIDVCLNDPACSAFSILNDGQRNFKSACINPSFQPNVEWLYIKKWSTYTRMDCGGNDLRQISGITREQCIDECANEVACVGFNIVDDGRRYLKRACNTDSLTSNGIVEWLFVKN